MKVENSYEPYLILNFCRNAFLDAIEKYVRLSLTTFYKTI